MKPILTIILFTVITSSVCFGQYTIGSKVLDSDFVPDEGLVVYYPFNGNANDESDNENHGIVQGPTLTNGRFGYPKRADQFNGGTDIISTSNPQIVNGDTSFSGKVDDIRIYNRVLSEGEVGALYEMEKPEPLYETGTGRDTGTEVVDVTNPATGRTWMDRNLGALRAAISSTDSLAYGDLYQWGRAADGHQKHNSPLTSILSSSDQPGHGSFIMNGITPWDWRSPQNINLWQGVNGVNNPCPAGYRLPTETEWNAERDSWGSNNAAGAFASPLKLPMTGYRNLNNGSLLGVGTFSTFGTYWSSTVSTTYAQYLYFGYSYSYIGSYYRALGFPVRCTKD